MSSFGGIICLACGGELPDSLRWAASLRCHNCRDVNAPVRADFGRWEREYRLMHTRLDTLRLPTSEAPSAA
jgi:hypothetical protein